NKAKDRAHIVEGLIKAISVLDELIELIRQSKNRQNAKDNIMATYDFTDKQADAILNLQLYRLTNTDVTLLQKEQGELSKEMKKYEKILGSEKVLLQKIKTDLRNIKKQYSSQRRTEIEDEIEEIKINIEVTVPTETVVVSVTNEGYIKRTSLRSYGASNRSDLTMKKSDYLISLMEIETTDQLLLFTNLGKYILIRVHDLPDIRWRESGVHISNIAQLENGEQIVSAIPLKQFDDERYVTFITKQGLVKKTVLQQYKTTRKAHSLIAINLREEDEVLQVMITDGTATIFLGTHEGYGICFGEEEVSPVGIRARGVIGIQLRDDDYVVNGFAYDENANEHMFIATHRGACKRMAYDSVEKTNRARRGSQLIRPLKTKPHKLVYID